MSAESRRVWNFSPGPAVLPVPVLERVRDELLVLPGAGASVMEISHRGSHFRSILTSAEERLRRLLSIGSDYRVVFLQGGSRLQFSMAPMNLFTPGGFAEYLITGSWSSKALVEARRCGEVKVVWNGKPEGYRSLPRAEDLELSGDAAFRYFTSNETIQGVQFDSDPVQLIDDKTPLVCDASSDFLCRPLPIQKYGLLYACAQKNAGPAGVTVVVIRDDLLARSDENLPGYLNYRSHVNEQSMYNTPPTFAVYVLELVLQWLEETIGGLEAMRRINEHKAKLLYDVLDQGYYRGHAEAADRSLMNVTFRLPTPEAEKQFLEQAGKHELTNLAGHRSVGGVRASIYNAMPTEGVQMLADFMKDFAASNG